MYKDSSCRSSSQPTPQTPPATVASATVTATATTTTATAATAAGHVVEEPPTNVSTSVVATLEDDPDPDADAAAVGSTEEALSGLSPSSSESDCEEEPLGTGTGTDAQPTTNTGRKNPLARRTSSSSNTTSSNAASVGASSRRPSLRCNVNVDVSADVRLLRKIGYIASRVRFLAKIYGDFRLVNPYSAAKQRRQLQEILLKHSIVDPARELARIEQKDKEREKEKIGGTSRSRSLTPISSIASSYCCLPTESSYDEESATTVRRRSSLAPTNAASIVLLEDLLVQFYEDRRQKVTVIRRRRSRRSSCGTVGASGGSNRNHLIIMSGQTASSSVERLLQLDNDNDDEEGEATAAAEGDVAVLITPRGFYNTITTTNVTNTNSTTTTTTTISSQQRPAFLAPSLSGIGIGVGVVDDQTRRRRASDCSTHPGQVVGNQLTLKNNNNCSKFPFHRGSCGGTGEHLLAANSIADRSTIILSKSCSNVDGGIGVGVGVGGPSNPALYGSTDLRNVSCGSGGGGAAGGTASGNTSGGVATNGNGNEYSIVQLNNTIIQCHFNDDDFRALVRDLKRKVEYTERMNWLCLSKRPLGPAHRKSSLPKHQEVKKRFLEICDSTFSDEVIAALRLPAFDSYEWSDANVIHLMQTMFVELGFMEKFHIPAETLREWLYEVYKHYNEVPFHNFRHCFCVAQMMYAITRQANLLQRLGDLECLILLVSCICHDLDHPGYNNIYQINARTELALRYNDISPLENHHCSIAFRLLEHPECNIFKHFNRDTFNQIREGIIRCILATDMARHNEILTQFKEITPIFDYSNRAHINLLCMVLIKVADISNEARPMDVAEPWLDRLLQEFFAQSAAEKSEGLPVTPFMDPDKVSKPGSQVRFIGLVLLPLFEALGDLVPELLELIIIPVRVALDYYRRLNDAQTKSRKSLAENNAAAVAESNSGAADAAAASTFSTGSSGGGGTSAAVSGFGGGTLNSAGNVSPQMPRSQSGMSVKSRRSIPSQKSASRTSVDEPQCIAAELHDLPEGSESGDSETATEVDVAEKTSKFKVDTEGSSNRSKSSHSTSRKSSREKRPSMIGEMCSSGGGQRIRNSYGNIHGYHSTNRSHFGSNRAVSLDQYSTNNRRLSDGLQQVISDSNVFYNRQNRSSLEAAATATAAAAATGRLIEDLNMNSASVGGAVAHLASLQAHPHHVPIAGSAAAAAVAVAHGTLHAATVASNQSQQLQSQASTNAASNGNISPTHTMPIKQHCCAAAAAAAAAAATASAVTNNSNGLGGNGANATGSAAKTSWKARLKQFSDYIGFSFDKSGKRFGSTRSSPCSMRNNNATIHGSMGSAPLDLITGKPGVCCTISNNLPSPRLRHKQQQHAPIQEHLISAGRHRAYSLDVPCSYGNPRYSSSSGGGDSSRKSSRHDGTVTGGGSGNGDDNNSNNTLNSSGGAGGEMPTCLPPPIRIGSVDASDTILISAGLPRVITPANIGSEPEANLSIDLGMASGSSFDPPKI